MIDRQDRQIDSIHHISGNGAPWSSELNVTGQH